MSTLKVGAIRGVSASSDAITVANDGTCTASITNKPNRNLVINGAMQVAQRGTSSTDNAYGSVDRFKMALSSVDENPTQSQADVASGTTPYSLGFRKAFKVTNGNQTSGAQTGDVIIFTYNIEAQDIVANTMFDGFIEISSKHIKQRNLDIPTYLVADFIEMNPVSVMKAYTRKIAPHY